MANTLGISSEVLDEVISFLIAAPLSDDRSEAILGHLLDALCATNDLGMIQFGGEGKRGKLPTNGGWICHGSSGTIPKNSDKKQYVWWKPVENR